MSVFGQRISDYLLTNLRRFIITKDLRTLSSRSAQNLQPDSSPRGSFLQLLENSLGTDKVTCRAPVLACEGRTKVQVRLDAGKCLASLTDNPRQTCLNGRDGLIQVIPVKTHSGFKSKRISSSETGELDSCTGCKLFRDGHSCVRRQRDLHQRN